jgi:hypothetical protein
MSAGGTLRARRFAWRRHKARSSAGSGTLAKSGARTHAGALAESRTCTGCSACRRAARRVHGTACAGGSHRSAGGSTHAGTLAWTAGASAGTAIENGTPALNAGSACALRRDWNRRGRRGGWRGVDRTRAGLRHDHAARSRSSFYRGRGNRNGSHRSRNRMNYRWSNRRCSDNRGLRSWRRGENYIAWCWRLCCSVRSAGGDDRRLRRHGAGRGFGGNGRSLRGRRDDGSSLARLRHNPAWSGLRRDRWRWCNLCRPLCGRSLRGRYRSSCNGSCGLRGGNRLRRRGHGNSRARRRRGSFFLLLLDRLEHVAGFRNARPVDLRFGGSGLGARTAGCAALAALEVSAHTLGFVEL